MKEFLPKLDDKQIRGLSSLFLAFCCNVTKISDIKEANKGTDFCLIVMGQPEGSIQIMFWDENNKLFIWLSFSNGFGVSCGLFYCFSRVWNQKAENQQQQQKFTD